MAFTDGELARAARNPWWRIAAVAGLAALAAVALLGGFEPAKGGVMAKPALTAGQRVDAGALAITPLRAWVSLKTPSGTANSYRPEQYLVLQARVENLTDTGYSAYSYLQSDLLLFSADVGGKPPNEFERPENKPANEPETMKADTLMRADDHTFTVALPPRLPVEVDLVWKLPPDRRIPAELTWGAIGRRFVEQTYLVRDSGWLQDRGVARWRLAVEDRRERAP